MNYLASGTQDTVCRVNKITAYSSTSKRVIETSVLTPLKKYTRPDKTISPLNTRDECFNSFKTVFCLQYILNITFTAHNYHLSKGVHSID